MKILYKFCAIGFFLVGVLQAANVFAGGTPVRKGTFILSTSFSYFHASRVWDKNGNAFDYPDSGYFNSGSVNIYAEYGASRRVTLVASLPYSYNTYAQSSGRYISQGLGDSELGARYYLTNVNFDFYLAFQATMVIPLYSNTANSNLGYQALGTDFKLVGSGSHKISGHDSFYYSMEVGGRQYFAEPGPFQVKSSATAGIDFNGANSLAISGAGIFSSSTNKNFSANLLENRDFSTVQAYVTAGHTFAPNFSMYVNYSRVLIGTNTGIGTNLSLSFITKF